MIIDNIAYYNKLASVHPLEKMLFAISSLLVCVFLNSIPVSIFILSLNTIILVFKARINLIFFLKLMSIPLYFLTLSVMSIAITAITHNSDIIFCFSFCSLNIGVTENSLFYAVNIFFKSIGSVSCLYFLVLTTPFNDITHVLRKIGLPEFILDLVCMIYRFIFILLDTAESMLNSQNSRLGYINLTNGFKSLGSLLSNLFVNSLNRANTLFIALESRNYNGTMILLENDYKFCFKNYILIILSLITYGLVFYSSLLLKG